ncbi:hypothetical protein NPIL_497041 [Nephila pilipes]|uniref:Uncharacterized protein n=1 Tax=Nephila pilipes TaxID=299642 RepID=A0A8X6N978_NEPPI|nr:hypothetical protein NPIL_497041 [Nephila pilipes]
MVPFFLIASKVLRLYMVVTVLYLQLCISKIPWGPKKEFYHPRNGTGALLSGPSVSFDRPIWTLNISPQGRSLLLFLAFGEFSIYCLGKRSGNESREGLMAAKG